MACNPKIDILCSTLLSDLRCNHLKRADDDFVWLLLCFGGRSDSLLSEKLLIEPLMDGMEARNGGSSARVCVGEVENPLGKFIGCCAFEGQDDVVAILVVKCAADG